MDIETIVQLISNLGFPIFVAVYLLIYFNRTMRCLTKAINELTIAVKQIQVKGE